MGVGVFNMDRWIIKKGLGRSILSVLAMVMTAVSVHAAQAVDRYSFISYTVLSPATGTTNINPGLEPGAHSYILLASRWGILLGDGLGISSIPSPATDESQVTLIGPALFYPNPFKQSVGAQLGYRLSRNADVELRVFDMRANQIIKTRFNAGFSGGIGGYNRLTMNQNTFNGFILSSGVYFFVLSSEGRVIGKGKFVVVP